MNITGRTLRGAPQEYVDGNPVEAGDAAARQGEWSTAIDAWLVGSTGRNGAEARKRIRWVAREGTRPQSFPTPGQALRRRIGALTITVLVGFALLFVFRDLASVVVSMAVWACITSSAALAIIIAHRIGNPDAAPLSENEIEQARAVISELERDRSAR